MAKDRPINPATAALKSSKTRAIKKSKAATAASRTEKLARRNPERLQKHLDELKAQREAQGGKLRPKDQQTLEQLERDVRLVRKAREEQSNERGGHEARGKEFRASERREGDAARTQLGKRLERDEPESEETETDEEVREIPMPRDAPPPVPPRHLQRSLRKNRISEVEAFAEMKNRRGRDEKPKEMVQAKKIYSSAPQLRDLQKEAVGKFVPAVVAARKRVVQSNVEAREGKGERLLEPEELEAIEQEEVKRGVKRRRVAEEAGRDVQRVDEMDEEERRLMEELGEMANEDGEMVAEEAEKEAEYALMAEEARHGHLHVDDVDATEKALRHVEMEELEDEEIGGKPRENNDLGELGEEIFTKPKERGKETVNKPTEQDEDDFW